MRVIDCQILWVVLIDAIPGLSNYQMTVKVNSLKIVGDKRIELLRDGEADHQIIGGSPQTNYLENYFK